jgi:hypothetical protein
VSDGKVDDVPLSIVGDIVALAASDDGFAYLTSNHLFSTAPAVNAGIVGAASPAIALAPPANPNLLYTEVEATPQVSWFGHLPCSADVTGGVRAGKVGVVGTPTFLRICQSDGGRTTFVRDAGTITAFEIVNATGTSADVVWTEGPSYFRNNGTIAEALPTTGMVPAGNVVALVAAGTEVIAVYRESPSLPLVAVRMGPAGGGGAQIRQVGAPSKLDSQADPSEIAHAHGCLFSIVRGELHTVKLP